MSKKVHDFQCDWQGNKAEQQFSIEAEYDSTCEIMITDIYAWCDVDGIKDWLPVTQMIFKQETIFNNLLNAVTEHIINNEVDYAEYQAEIYHESQAVK